MPTEKAGLIVAIKKLVTTSGKTFVVGGEYPGSSPAKVTKITRDRSGKCTIYNNQGGWWIISAQYVRSVE